MTAIIAVRRAIPGSEMQKQIVCGSGNSKARGEGARRRVTGREKKRFVCPNKRTLRGCRRGRAANAARWLRCVRKRSQRNSRKTSTQGAAAAAARGRRLHRPGGQCGLVCTGLGWPGLVWPRLKTAMELSWQRTRQHGSLMAAANVICDLCFHGKCWARKLRQTREMGGGREGEPAAWQ